MRRLRRNGGVSVVSPLRSEDRRAGTPPRPSFASVVAAHRDAVYRYLVHLVRNHHVAEDLASATFERALRDWHRFDPRKGTPAVWLVQIARLTALDHFRSEDRRRAREARYAATEPREAAAAALPEETSGALREALGRLSRSDRELVALRVVLEMDTREVAQALGISTSAVTTQLHRAMTKLRNEVSRDDA
jgi:RNA polymerase sigma factor (sigma-70 family)